LFDTASSSTYPVAVTHAHCQFTSPPAGPVGPVAPVTPVGPVGPVAPAGPVAPVGPPLGQVAPSGPVAPVAPAGPVAPVGPVTPIGPVGPVAPTGPVAPVTPAGPVAPVGPPLGPVGPVGPVAHCTKDDRHINYLVSSFLYCCYYTARNGYCSICYCSESHRIGPVCHSDSAWSRWACRTLCFWCIISSHNIKIEIFLVMLSCID